MTFTVVILLIVWFLNIEEGISSSSSIAKVHQFPRELSFITSSAEVFKGLKVIEDAAEEYGYNLNGLAKEFKCPMSQLDSEGTAKEFIQFLMKDIEEVKTIVKLHPTFIFNGVKSDDLFELYISK